MQALVCEAFLAEKSEYKKPFGMATRKFYLLELVHSNNCGPMNTKARHGIS